MPQHRWITKLLGYDFTVEFKPGKDNIVADALSRQHEDISLHMISSADFAYYDDLCSQLKTHPSWSSKYNDWSAGALSTECEFVDGLLLFRHRIFVPEDFPGIQNLFSVAHSVGHEGIAKTWHRLQASFYIPGG